SGACGPGPVFGPRGVSSLRIAPQHVPRCGQAAQCVARQAENGVASAVARETGAALVKADVDGVLFTGSHAGGRAIHRALAGRPEVLLALEMGGNNPIVVHDAADLDAAAILVAVSAFISAGQRCTCARRLIVIDGPEAEALLERITSAADALIVGLPDEDPAPFIGPVISAAAGWRCVPSKLNAATPRCFRRASWT
ncbi:MAG: aldehyde dehydrogenase family protein, partial [Planctomycetota bacterium]